MGWKGKILSSVRKLEPLLTSLHGIPMYFLSLFKLLGRYKEIIEKIQRNFLWYGMEDKDKISLVS